METIRSTVRMDMDSGGASATAQQPSPQLTLEMLDGLLRTEPPEEVLFATLSVVDDLVAGFWRRSPLENGNRESRNCVFGDEVRVYERRRSVLGEIAPRLLKRDFAGGDPAEPGILRPRGPEDEAYALAPNSAFMEPMGGYEFQFLAKGWEVGNEPQYESIRFIADCVVSDPDDIQLREYGVGQIVEAIGVNVDTGNSTRDHSRHLARIRECLSRSRLARACGPTASVVVFPELTIDDALLGQIEEKAAAATLAVLGSRHRQEGPGWRNVATAMYSGDRWEHRKVTSFAWPGALEPIRLSPRQIIFVDTPLGRVCVVVCKDFLSPFVLRAVARAGTDLVLVPAMTPSGQNSLFAVHARELATRIHATTLFANCCAQMRRQLGVDAGTARERNPGGSVRQMTGRSKGPRLLADWWGRVRELLAGWRKLRRVGFLFLPLDGGNDEAWYGCSTSCSAPSMDRYVDKGGLH